MRKMILRCDTEYCGTESIEGYLVTDEQYTEYLHSTKPSQMDIFASVRAQENAEMYGIESADYMPEDYDDDYDYDDISYSESITGEWLEYDEDVFGNDYDWSTI